MTSIKLYEVGYDESGYGTVTIMIRDDGSFFLIRDGIPHGDDEEEIDDPGMEISSEDMEAFCRAALSYIENKKELTEKAPEHESGVLGTKVCELGLPVRLFNLLKIAFYGDRDGWPKIEPEDITLGDIIKHSRREYMKFRNFGGKSLYDLETLLDKYNLKLKR